MRPVRTFLLMALRLLLAWAAGTVCTLALAQADPPGRVAVITLADGPVVLTPVGETDWSDALLNWPLVSGDRIWAESGSRAEVHAGSAVLHMDGASLVDIATIDDLALHFNLAQGSLNARVRQLAQGDRFEIGTPNLAVRALGPGDFRVDVDAQRGTTRVSVHSGVAALFGAGGEHLEVQAGQQVSFSGRNLSHYGAGGLPLQDAFDLWAAERNWLEDESISARYVPRDVVGYPLLDQYGSWTQDLNYGPVWYPRVTVANWAPYRDGRWRWIAPWGWTWIDAAPWGFAPFHYGRWVLIGPRWAWVPSHIPTHRPVYSPALVAFVGGAGSAISWFPLAPGEAWRPHFHASAAYLSRLDRQGTGRANAPLAYQRRPEALTSVSMEDFSRGRPVRTTWRPVPAADLAKAQAVLPPPRPARTQVADDRRPAPRVQLPFIPAAAPVTAIGRSMPVPSAGISPPPRPSAPVARHGPQERPTLLAQAPRAEGSTAPSSAAAAPRAREAASGKEAASRNKSADPRRAASQADHGQRAKQEQQQRMVEQERVKRDVLQREERYQLQQTEQARASRSMQAERERAQVQQGIHDRTVRQPSPVPDPLVTPQMPPLTSPTAGGATSGRPYYQKPPGQYAR